MLEIRKAQRSDTEAIMELIQELAIYEKAENQVKNTPEKLAEDGFGNNPLWFAFLAEWSGEVAGMALYYFRYSTWKGKRLYLEDLIVRETFRGKGIGKALLEATVEEAKSVDCSGMMWQVLDWNEPAIKFYKDFGAEIDTEWHNCHLDFTSVPKGTSF